jgi:hypothetical protein
MTGKNACNPMQKINKYRKQDKNSSIYIYSNYTRQNSTLTNGLKKISMRARLNYAGSKEAKHRIQSSRG